MINSIHDKMVLSIEHFEKKANCLVSSKQNSQCSKHRFGHIDELGHFGALNQNSYCSLLVQLSQLGNLDQLVWCIEAI